MEKIALTEFCKKLSLDDKRVELIGGFYHWMRHEKKVERDTAKKFQGYYIQFCNAPA